MGSFLLTGLAWAGDSTADGQNNHNAPYLRMGVGARALGMGGAFVGVANDLTAGYWNPAGLAWTSGWQVGGMFSSGMEVDRKYNQIGASLQRRVGCCRIQLAERRNDRHQQPRRGWARSGHLRLHGQRLHALLGQAASTSPRFGITGKYLRESNGGALAGQDDGTNGYGIDLGFGLQLTDQIRFGMAVQDIAGKLGTVDDVEDIPTNLRMGLAVWPIRYMTAAFDVEKTAGHRRLRLPPRWRVSCSAGQGPECCGPRRRQRRRLRRRFRHAVQHGRSRLRLRERQAGVHEREPPLLRGPEVRPGGGGVLVCHEGHRQGRHPRRRRSVPDFGRGFRRLHGHRRLPRPGQRR